MKWNEIKLKIWRENLSQIDLLKLWLKEKN